MFGHTKIMLKIAEKGKKITQTGDQTTIVLLDQSRHWKQVRNRKHCEVDRTAEYERDQGSPELSFVHPKKSQPKRISGETWIYRSRRFVEQGNRHGFELMGL